jgi:kinase suppressor of Ras 1
VALRAAAMGEKKEGGGGGAAAAGDGDAGAAASRALQQCGQLQKLIDISIGSLRGLRTKCAVSNDLTQQEIRTLEVRGLGAGGSGSRLGPRSGPQCIPSRVASWSRVSSSSSTCRCIRQRGDPGPALTLGRV